MIDNETKKELEWLEQTINFNIDILIPKREAAVNGIKHNYRYIIKKLEVALEAVHKAQDKIKEMEK